MNSIIEIVLIIGFLSILHLTYRMQLYFGNWLYVNYPNLWLRKIWWSEFDLYRDYKFECDFKKAYVEKKYD